MDLEEITRERHELLERLKDSLQEELIACESFTPKDEGAPEILTVVLDGIGEEGGREGAVGDFFFMPLYSEEDKVQYFCAVLTLMDDVDNDRLPALFEAMSYINFELTSGNFCIDREKSILAYKLTLTLPMDVSGDVIYEAMNFCLDDAVNVADLYADILIKISDGGATLEDLKDIL